MSPSLRLRQSTVDITDDSPAGHYVSWLGDKAQILAHRCFDQERYGYSTMLGGMRLVGVDLACGKHTVAVYYERDPRIDSALSREAADVLEFMRQRAPARGGFMFEYARPHYEAGKYHDADIAELLAAGAIGPHADPKKGWIVL
jgi:hypothetical protein